MATPSRHLRKSGPRQPPWSQEEITLLRKLVASGEYKNPEIAKIIGHSYNSVTITESKLKIKGRVGTPRIYSVNRDYFSSIGFSIHFVNISLSFFSSQQGIGIGFGIKFVYIVI